MKIRIIAVPPGQAPQRIREQWVGVEIPVIEQPPPGQQFGVLGGKPDPRNARGYLVGTDEAIQALSKKSSEAAAWWRAWREETVAGQLAAGLVFAREVCEEI